MLSTIIASSEDLLPAAKIREESFLPPWLTEKEVEEYRSIGIWDRKHSFATSRLIAKFSFYLLISSLHKDEKNRADIPVGFLSPEVAAAVDGTDDELKLWPSALLEKNIAQMPHDFPKTTVVLRDEHGAPFIKTGSLSVPLSISHSEELVAAVCSRNTLAGIDIQSVDERPLSFYEEAFNIEELLAVQKAVVLLEDEQAYIHAAFSAKEACYKTMRVNMIDWHKEIVITSFRPPAFTAWDMKTGTRFEGKVAFLHSPSGRLYSAALALIIK